MIYEDFKIRFLRPRGGKDGSGTYTISIESPAGNDEGVFVLPFTPDDLAEKLTASGLVTRSASPEPAVVKQDEVSSSMRAVGEQLFSALIQEKNVRHLYLKNLSTAVEHGERGLRIKLCVNPDYPELATLMNLPWEYMFDSLEKRDYLGLFESLPIVRFLDLHRPVGPVSVDKLPLKILVMVSSPSNYPELDVEKEKALLVEALAGHEAIELTVLEEPTLLGMRKTLASGKYHIFHYIGHGGFAEDTGEGKLVFEDDDGMGVAVSGERLKRALRGSSVGIVFLNACETARVAADKDPFAGVALSLMIENILAVVAMQFPISDTSAIQFSREFYTALAEGDPIDQAVTKGRQAIDFGTQETLEWGIPVLFMRSHDGVVFNMKETAKPRAARGGTEVRRLRAELALQFCRKCGDRLMAGGQFCRKCGAKVRSRGG